jgi:hypothetical protein
MPMEVPPAAEAADVIFIATEDVKATTSVPRLRVAGADLSRVHFVEAMPTTTDPDAPPLLAPGLIGQLEEAVARRKARLVVIDPLFNYLPGDVNANSDQDVRSVLKPLAAMAERCRCAVVIVRHLKKGEGSAMYRGSGSIGLAAAARSVLFLAKDPNNKDSPLYLAQVKSSVGERAPTLAWRLVSGGAAPKIRWEGVADIGADDLANVPEAAKKATPEDDEVPVLEHCEALLREMLADGPVLSKTLESDLSAAIGASKTTVMRARKNVGARAIKGSDGQWSVEMPGWETVKAAKTEGPRAIDNLDGAPSSNQLRLHGDLVESKDAKPKNAKPMEKPLAFLDPEPDQAAFAINVDQR